MTNPVLQDSQYHLSRGHSECRGPISNEVQQPTQSSEEYTMSGNNVQTQSNEEMLPRNEVTSQTQSSDIEAG